MRFEVTALGRIGKRYGELVSTTYANFLLRLSLFHSLFLRHSHSLFLRLSHSLFLRLSYSLFLRLSVSRALSFS